MLNAGSSILHNHHAGVERHASAVPRKTQLGKTHEVAVESFAWNRCLSRQQRWGVRVERRPLLSADVSGTTSSLCEAVTVTADGSRRNVLPPMHEPRCRLACVAIGGCVIVAGGERSITTEVYEEGLGRWRRLSCSLLHDRELTWMGSVSI
jgi:hypothetical protein